MDGTKLEKLRIIVEACERDGAAGFSMGTRTGRALLERVGELENTIERMAGKLKAERDYQTELKAENENLKREAEGLHAMIQQAIHPQSE